MHARQKEEIAEALAKAKQESYAQHEQQMAEAKRQMDEMMSGMTAMLQGAMLRSNMSSFTNFSVTKNVAVNLMKLACLLQCIVMCY